MTPNIAQINIIGSKVACKEGLKDSWREVAIWTADRLHTIYGDKVSVHYFDMFDLDCPSLPKNAKLPVVFVNEHLISIGGKISTPLIREELEELGIYPQ
ncbi:MAG: hypothetical protein BGO78_16820 [Chloroflexi bacterium 44-23]|nr:MAG: hypothetical protein BGO78_16820 [Chloroflexi bacterium 44-23]